MHRRPVPLKLFEAIVSVSIGPVCGCVIIAYFGCCRMGEVLRAKRKHLVLAADLGLATTSAGSLVLSQEREAWEKYSMSESITSLGANICNRCSEGLMVMNPYTLVHLPASGSAGTHV